MSLRPRLDQAAKLADVALTPGAYAAARAGKPFSLSAFRLVTQIRARVGAVRVVLDAGANKGQFSRAAATAFPGARLIAFEPLEAVAAEWRANLADVAGAEVHACALGAEDGTVTFHPHEYSLSSSVLPLAEGAGAEGGGGAGELAAVEVPVRRLDDVVTLDDLRAPLLAKLDVQGYELEVLRGATATLAHVDALVVELAFERQYEGQPTFTEVLDAVAGLGFALDVPIDVRRDESGTIVEMDGLFRPAS